MGSATNGSDVDFASIGGCANLGTGGFFGFDLTDASRSILPWLLRGIEPIEPLLVFFLTSLFFFVLRVMVLLFRAPAFS